MKQTLLDRYERTDAGSIIIDIAAARAEDLYNDFDKHSPHIRRDLDQNLVDYLIDCARELVPQSFILRFTFGDALDESRTSRIRGSVNAFFLYLVERERRQILQMLRRSAILFFLGLAILFLAVSANNALGQDASVVARVFAEGLTVAAWVSLWESLAIFLLEWFPHRKNTALYRQLASAEIEFRTEVAPKAG